MFAREECVRVYRPFCGEPRSNSRRPGQVESDDSNRNSAIPRGPEVVPLWRSYVESHKSNPKKELLWGLWVSQPTPDDSFIFLFRTVRSNTFCSSPPTCSATWQHRIHGSRSSINASTFFWQSHNTTWQGSHKRHQDTLNPTPSNLEVYQASKP